MKKAELEALEKVFTHEITRALSKGTQFPFQSKAKIYRQLADEGFLREEKMTFRDRWGSMECTGWELTHAGRLAYCMTCTGEPEGA
jgi:hypothetical protein